MKNNIEKVYGKLPKKKLDLKAHKVALGLIEDIENKFQEGVLSFNEAKNNYLKAQSDLGQVLFVFEDDIANDVLNLKNKINELGVQIPQNIEKIENDSKAFVEEASNLLNI